MGSGGRLAQGKRVVTADDFIVDDEEDVEYETASSDPESEANGPDEELEQNWVDWAEGEDVDEKLRDVLETKGARRLAIVCTDCAAISISFGLKQLVCEESEVFMNSKFPLLLSGQVSLPLHWLLRSSLLVD